MRELSIFVIFRGFWNISNPRSSEDLNMAERGVVKYPTLVSETSIQSPNYRKLSRNKKLSYSGARHRFLDVRTANGGDLTQLRLSAAFQIQISDNIVNHYKKANILFLDCTEYRLL